MRPAKASPLSIGRYRPGRRSWDGDGAQKLGRRVRICETLLKGWRFAMRRLRCLTGRRLHEVFSPSRPGDGKVGGLRRLERLFRREPDICRLLLEVRRPALGRAPAGGPRLELACLVSPDAGCPTSASQSGDRGTGRRVERTGSTQRAHTRQRPAPRGQMRTQ